MRTITKYIYLFYAMILPFGAINPFDLSSIRGISERISEQQGLGQYFFALCVICALLDGNVRKQIVHLKKLLLPLFLLFCTLFCSELVYTQFSTIDYVFYIKLLVGEFGFVIIAQYFIEYPIVMRKSLMLYSYTCVLIILAFFLGFLRGYYFTSNGQLWLFGENPNTYSFMIGLGSLILVNDIVHNKESLWLLIINFVSIVLIVFYLILSGSRGTILMVAACLLVLSYRVILKKWIIVLPIILISVSLVVGFVNKNNNDISLFERFNALQESRGDRSNLIKEAWSLYAERPLFGFGRTGYVEERLIRYREERDSHNLLLSTAAMGGTVAVICLLAFLGIMFKECLKKRKSLLFATVLFLYIFLMSMKTGDVITFAMMWYSYGVVFSLATTPGKIVSLPSASLSG